MIVCLYRSPSGDISLFFEKLDSILNTIANVEKTNFIVCGDFNIDFQMESNHQKFLRNLFSDYGGKSIVKQPTRVTMNSSSQIDNVFTNLRNCDSFVEDCTFSDHSVIYFEIKHVGNYFHYFDTATFRKVTDESLRVLNPILENEDWKEVYQLVDVDDKFNCFLRTFSDYLSVACPIKTVQIQKYKKSEWITLGIKKSAEHLRQLQTLNKIGSTPALKSKLKIYSRVFQRLIKASNRMIVEKKIINAKSRPDVLWKIIKSEYKTTTRDCEIPFITANDVKIRDPWQIAANLNNYFVNFDLDTS